MLIKFGDKLKLKISPGFHGCLRQITVSSDNWAELRLGEEEVVGWLKELMLTNRELPEPTPCKDGLCFLFSGNDERLIVDSEKLHSLINTIGLRVGSRKLAEWPADQVAYADRKDFS